MGEQKKGVLWCGKNDNTEAYSRAATTNADATSEELGDYQLQWKPNEGWQRRGNVEVCIGYVQSQRGRDWEEEDGGEEQSSGSDGKSWRSFQASGWYSWGKWLLPNHALLLN